ncbi:MAG: family 43 glycosylhydrolase [Lachnospiraceae bacterium]|nr:family 43 glycosylhydrolase [Lachnospiraceae bacterium]MDD3616060.1 family 43 glycosylhydrolase [Lachnospiraceae bacterium]
MNKTQIRTTEYNQPWIAQRADPYVYKHSDNSYYFTASVPAYDRIILRKADTIEGLKAAEEVTLWTRHEEGEQSIHIWAPEIHYIFGGWYIYYAAGDKDDIWEIRPYVLRCTGDDPMTDEWEEMGMMQAADDDLFSFHAFSLDATVFQHRGDYYYIWAEKTGVGKMVSNLYIARMQAPNKLATQQILLTTPDYGWERVDFWVNEGPAILKHDGKIFMTFSASATGACYCMGMMYIDENEDVLDPNAWTKLNHPVLQTDEEKGIYGPGHNSFAMAEDGVTQLCVYHARQYDKIQGDPLYDPNRHAMLMKVTYDENGFPEFRYSVV